MTAMSESINTMSRVDGGESLSSQPSVDDGGTNRTDGSDFDSQSMASDRSSTTIPTRSPCPDIRLFCGTFVHSADSDPMQILKDAYLAVLDGKIVKFGPMTEIDSIIAEYNMEEWLDECIFRMSESMFLMPGFVDTHASAVEGLALGLDPTHEISNSSNKARRVQEKLNMIHSDKFAHEALSKIVKRSLSNGTTCAAYTGSSLESAARLLTEVLDSCHQRAFVGLDARVLYNRDDAHMIQFAKVRDFMAYLHRKKKSKVQPHLICSKPLPDWLQRNLADIQRNNNVPLKIYLGDVSDDFLRQDMGGWAEIGDSSFNHYRNTGLIHGKSILVHCNGVSDNDIITMGECGITVVHCPVLDRMNPQRLCPVRKCIHHGLEVGLGSDISKSRNTSMLHAIRNSLEISKVQWHEAQRTADHRNKVKELEDRIQRLEMPEKSENSFVQYENCNWEENKPLTIQEVFYMATLGGAKVLGLSDDIGSFEIGKEFDAIVVDCAALNSPFDVFLPHDTIEDMIEKFLLLGDDRNVVKVFVCGKQLKDSL